MERMLRGIRSLFVGAFVVGVMALWLENTTPTLAESRTTRRVGGAMATLDKMDLSRFRHEGLEEKTSDVAILDDVKTTCNKTGTIPALVEGIYVKDGVTPEERAAMLYNSWMLQNMITCASARTTIYLPAGTFYFMSGHLKKAEDIVDENGNVIRRAEGFERHVIKPANYVSLAGAGTDENGINTTLKIYSEESEFRNNKMKGGAVDGGIDMFFYNDYAAYNGRPDDGQDYYLKGVNYYDFIIDSEDTRGVVYNTMGKGFMINLFKDSAWDNVVVKNTDATGFGVDAPINGKIINSRAVGCGKAANENSQGASGFGIGTGFSDNESMEIRDSVSIGNKKFGYFYEHQGRFNPQLYTATRAANDKAFRVTNSYAEGNLYNYGGLRANDVYYANSKSVATGATRLDVYFSDESRQVAVSGIDIDNKIFNDVGGGSYYADAVQWAVKNGITNGVGAHRFGVGQTIRRADAVVMLWRMMNRFGKVLSVQNGNLETIGGRWQQNIIVCYADVPGNAYYTEAVKWAHEKGITNGVKACSSENARDGEFSPDRGITRAEFVAMLWRMAGAPSVGKVQDFSDVTDSNLWYYNAVQWAAATGITSGIGKNRFGPDYDCTREQAVALLYRYFGNR